MPVATDAQRVLGAFYTPPDVAAMMASWALSGGAQSVLEPSFGDGAFINALRESASTRGIPLSITAVELSDETFAAANGWTARDKPILSDFHAVPPFDHDAVIGNPPFVRFRNLSGDLAQRARSVGSEALGAPIDESGSIWMTFTLHASRFLREGGRLGLVLPNDATYVRYAVSFWKFIGDNFGDVRILRSRERIFDDLLQDVVLLLADGFGRSSTAFTSEVYESRADLIRGRRAMKSKVLLAEIAAGRKPFVRALAGPRLAGLLEQMQHRVAPAGEQLKFSIGYVDAAKSFFHPAKDVVREFRLPERSLRPALRSGRHWIGSGLRTSNLPAAALTRLWLPDPKRLTAGEHRYVAHGESLGIHAGHKTSRRDPWFVVPGVAVPDVIVPVFADRPRLLLNDAGVVVSNSLMAATWRDAPGSGEALAMSWHSSIAQLGIELAVHSLGGGVLVLVPRECHQILVPRQAPSRPTRTAVRSLERALTQNAHETATDIADNYLTKSGWKHEELNEARELAAALRAWRVVTK